MDRLRDIGDWMKLNSTAIYGTKASPFKDLPWGRCTQKQLEDGKVRLFLHIFEWPEKRKLIVPGIYNKPQKAYLLADDKKGSLQVKRKEDALVIKVPSEAPDAINSVVVLDILLGA